jgi:hypothetical protein
MTPRTTQQAFEEFERTSVRVPDAENKLAKTVQAELRAVLREQLDELHFESFLAGSYPRKTQAVRLKDLDLVVVLRDPAGKFAASASGTLALIRKVAQAYPRVSGATTKCRAIECDLTGVPFWVDVVPALEDEQGGLLLAYVDRDENIDEWRPADPKGQIHACQAKNAQTAGIYVPVTRICKFWNQSFTSSPEQEKPLPSYMVEAVLFDAVDRPLEWAEGVLVFFENACRHLSESNATVPCPGKSTEFVDEKLDPLRQARALTKVEAVLPTVRSAAGERDPTAAMNLWAQVFGPAFPARATDSRTMSNALRTGSFSVVGSGISPSPTAGRLPIPARSHGPKPADS